jgi:flagellar basal body-associated protein FliL
MDLASLPVFLSACILKRVSEQSPSESTPNPAQPEAAVSASTPAPANTPAGAESAANSAASPESTEAAGKVAEVSRKSKVAAEAFKKFLSKRGGIWLELPGVFFGIFSRDRPTRKMSLVFVASLLGIVLVSGIAVKRYWNAKKRAQLIEAREIEKRNREILEKEAFEARRRDSVVSLGSFALELKPVPNQHLGPGVVNMAQMEIMLVCDGPETRDYIKEHMVQTRNQMTQVFTALDREELMSRDGKKKLKGVIIRKLNGWLPHGKVDDLFFSKLIIN